MAVAGYSTEMRPADTQQAIGKIYSSIGTNDWLRRLIVCMIATAIPLNLRNLEVK